MAGIVTGDELAARASGQPSRVRYSMDIGGEGLHRHPAAMTTFTSRYDIRCDREAWNNTTLHCTMKEAINYAYNLCDEETGPIDVMTINAKGFYVVAYTVNP